MVLLLLFSGIGIWTGSGSVPAPIEPKWAEAPTPQQIEFFEKRVRPVLAEHCYECHSAGSAKLKGGLLVDSRAGLRKGGDTAAAILPGDPASSLLIQAVRHARADLTMPPKKKLSEIDIASLEDWVRMGAPDPRTEDTVAAAKKRTAIDWNKAREFWSFRPIHPGPIPSVKLTSWPANNMDRFILAALEKAGLRPGPDADRRTLIRRATYDLTGLPPTGEEIEAFLADRSPEAFSRVVDRLLASPRYGERWGRHWLDVVRYSDSAGDNSDFPIPQIYRYRNWVIAAMNRDLPYDEFVRQQLAGDLLPASGIDEKHEKLIATGYIANARRFGSRVSDYPQHLTIEDTIDNFGRTFLGMTINCARCHDHKFDPLSTEDYYAIYGFFHNTRYPWPGIELEQKQRDLVPLAPESEVEQVRKQLRERQEQLDAGVKRQEAAVKAAEGDAKKELEKALQKAKKEADDLRRAPLPFPQAYAVAEASKIEDAPVQQRGDPAKPGATVRRRFLTILNGAELPPDDRTSGRLQLAEWILAPDNPLTARVMVNRIWLHHFGKGIVPTPNDFGRQGKPPTHPELLDWLATRFRESGWSLKSMHRLMMLSRTYQLAGARTDEAVARDPGNDLLSAFPRRRLDAESLRDSLLALGGNLDTTPGGPHPFPPQDKWKFTQHNPFKAVYETNHRSVYLMTQRIQRHPYLGIFDGADPAASTALRMASTTPLQALYLLNDAFVHAQANGFAARLLAAEPDIASRFHRAFVELRGRPPEPDELMSSRQFLENIREKLSNSGTPAEKLETEAWQAFTRVLFRLNDFLYVD